MTLFPRPRLVCLLLVATSATLGCGSSGEQVPPREPVVALEGRAQEVLDRSVFVLTDTRTEPRDVLLVVDRRGTDVRPGERVRVSGSLRIFRIDDARRNLGRPLDEARFERFEGVTYVEARRVERLAPDDE